MCWIEEPNSLSVSELSNSQIVENILYARRRCEYLYRRELRKLELIKSKLIIKNLDEFSSVEIKYSQTKSMKPETWLESWDVYKELLREVNNRGFIIDMIRSA